MKMHHKTRDALVRRIDAAIGYIERGWTRGALARDANGKSVNPTHFDAAAWCAIGAVGAACAGRRNRWEMYEEITQRLHDKTQERYGAHSVVSFNDNSNRARTRRQIIRIFKDVRESLLADA